MGGPRALPRLHLTINGNHKGEFYWDSRLMQLRKVDNPHAFDNVDDPELASMLESLQPGDSYQEGGGASPVFIYRRVS